MRKMPVRPALFFLKGELQVYCIPPPPAPKVTQIPSNSKYYSEYYWKGLEFESDAIQSRAAQRELEALLRSLRPWCMSDQLHYGGREWKELDPVPTFRLPNC